MPDSLFQSSQTEILARIAVALDAAELAGPRVERQPIPLYLSFLDELIDDQKVSAQMPVQEVAERLHKWRDKQDLDFSDVVFILSEHLNEVCTLSKAHGTLAEGKQQELLTLHNRINDILSLLSVSMPPSVSRQPPE